MSHSIAVDPHRNMAVLVMDEPLFGLGPAVVADDPDEAQELLQTFVANLGAEPSQMPTLELMNEWQSFLIAFHGYLQVPAEVAAQQAQEPATPPPDPEPDPEPTQAPGDPQTAADAATPTETAPAASPGDSAGDASSPPTEPEPDGLPNDGDWVRCFACGGDKTIEIDGERFACGTCGGRGYLPAQAA